MKKNASEAVKVTVGYKKKWAENVSIEIVTSEQDFDSLEVSWSQLCEASECSIFQTFEWNRTWWKYFGNSNSLHLVILKREGEMIAIFPLFRDSVEVLGHSFYTALRFLGSNVSQPQKANMLGLISYTDYLDGIIKKGEAGFAYELIVPYLAGIFPQMDEIILDVIPEQSAFWMHALPLIHKEFSRVHIIDQEPSQLIVCSSSWQDYLTRLNKNRRYKAKTALRKIHGAGSERIFQVRSPKSEDEFIKMWNQFVDLHQKKWNKLGSIGTFYERSNLQFHQDISLQFFKKGWAQIYALSPIQDENELLAMDLNYMFKGRMYGAHTVTNTDSEYYKEGPGTALFFETLLNAIEQNFTSYDFLRGSEAYKYAVSDLTFRNRTVHLKSNRRLQQLLYDLFINQEKLRRTFHRKAAGIRLRLKHSIGIIFSF
ncbi:GNAT family N-acetyltransferase [Gracilimonas tropica]|uniref:GNAT family N-acetyltransferase n=1 Tax=Gracilimonas tropica TaxID=454600 RepID=UPI0003635A62|nr:GNAT family N-acetyltransferase [Gracilimonas tropica]